MIALIAQVAPPLERLHGIRDRFVQGGSAAGVLAALAGVAAIIVTVYALVAWRRRSTRVEHSPDQLFEDLLREVVSSPQQRHLLRRIARDQKISQPAVLLMNATILERYAHTWLGESERESVKAQLSGIIATVRRASDCTRAAGAAPPS